MYIPQRTVERIKKIAKEKGIATTIMLQECELNKNTLSSMNNRGSWLQADSLAKIADYLDCSVDYLLRRTDNPELSKESYYINGDNNGIQSNKGSVSIESKRKNDIEEEFMQAFEKLELSDKVDVMSFTMQKMKKED